MVAQSRMNDFAKAYRTVWGRARTYHRQFLKKNYELVAHIEDGHKYWEYNVYADKELAPCIDPGAPFNATRISYFHRGMTGACRNNKFTYAVTYNEFPTADTRFRSVPPMQLYGFPLQDVRYSTILGYRNHTYRTNHFYYLLVYGVYKQSSQSYTFLCQYSAHTNRWQIKNSILWI